MLFISLFLRLNVRKEPDRVYQYKEPFVPPLKTVVHTSKLKLM